MQPCIRFGSSSGSSTVLIGVVMRTHSVGRRSQIVIDALLGTDQAPGRKLDLFVNCGCNHLMMALSTSDDAEFGQLLWTEPGRIPAPGR